MFYKQDGALDIDAYQVWLKPHLQWSLGVLNWNQELWLEFIRNPVSFFHAKIFTRKDSSRVLCEPAKAYQSTTFACAH